MCRWFGQCPKVNVLFLLIAYFWHLILCAQKWSAKFGILFWGRLQETTIASYYLPAGALCCPCSCQFRTDTCLILFVSNDNIWRNNTRENGTTYSPISAVFPNSGKIASFARLCSDPPTRTLKYSFRTSSPFPCSDQLLREYITTTSGNIRPSWSPLPQPPHVKSPLSDVL